jgi:hypothetical protein
MKLTLEIGRLVLDGLAATPAEATRIRAAATGELRRLLCGGTVSARLLGGGALPSLAAPAFDLTPGATPEAIGRGIARSVYRSFGSG